MFRHMMEEKPGGVSIGAAPPAESEEERDAEDARSERRLRGRVARAERLAALRELGLGEPLLRSTVVFPCGARLTHEGKLRVVTCWFPVKRVVVDRVPDPCAPEVAAVAERLRERHGAAYVPLGPRDDLLAALRARLGAPAADPPGE